MAMQRDSDPRSQLTSSPIIRLVSVSSIAMAMLIGTLGCGKSGPKPEKLVPAAGLVKVNGRPLAGVRLSFQPIENNKAVGGCWAITDNDGKFKVIHVSSKEGIPPGKYEVYFSRRVKPDGSPLGENESPTMVQSRESVSAMYSDPSRAGMHNRIEIPEKGVTDLDFTISTSAPKKK
ncbi:hypothetical protein [Schlesneria sp. T3-172]|uniref:hypothetical protein n=1 Tax=Schlesneria sphaerica TaxID=3373610 RepID=UPI0037C9C04D